MALEDAMSADEFWDFCVANPEGRFELTAEGEIAIVPPAGWESDRRTVKVIVALESWAEHTGRGIASGSSVAFVLPTGAAYSPVAAWTSKERAARVSKERKRKFPPVCPEFIVEVMSPSDRLSTAKKKMQEWMRGGVELAWLIDADKREIYSYRAGQAEPECLKDAAKIAGEGPVAGFELNLKPVWEGL